MTILAWTLTLTLHLSGATVTSWTLNFNPVVQVTTNLAWLPGPHDQGLTAMSLPSVVLMTPQENRYRHIPGSSYYTIIREELRHEQQMSALGPWFWLSYGATLGRPFEPYGNVNVRGGAKYAAALSRMWMPSPALRDRCPLFQMSGSADAVSYSVLPCYRVASFSATSAVW